ncbi:MAG: mycofactocin system transcriptional regulator [Microthrixaceae bacterium]
MADASPSPITQADTRTRGRPEVTSRGEIERAAFELFATHGFGGTTLDMIAGKLGVARRTLFRYFDSKNDIPWGSFEESLAGFEVLLEEFPEEVPLWEAVHRGVVAFNDFDPEVLTVHRERMRLILSTPALQAHSALRYQAWRAVIARFVGSRCSLEPDDLYPRTAGHVSLALALAAYEQWLDPRETRPLGELLDAAMRSLREHLS